MKLEGREAPYEAIAAAIEGVEGVLAHGLLLNTVSEVVLAGPDGPETLRKVGDTPFGVITNISILQPSSTHVQRILNRFGGHCGVVKAC